ncbi:MAG: tRNA (guanosine(37)-N1)-methyltransferase TrmD [Planctomycetota bacterium]
MRIDVLTTFPEMFAAESPAALGVSIPGRAQQAGLLDVCPTDIRAHADNKHNKTDDRPYGGGPGMVMMCQPIFDAVRAAEAADDRPATRVYLSPQGERLTQPIVRELAALPRLLILCGHYEGVDQRVLDRLEPRELSIGDYVLSSGELAAMVLIDAIARLLPGVLGDDTSAQQDSFDAAPATNPNGEAIAEKLRARWLAELGVAGDAQLLDCPHYTRPRVWDGEEVPTELLSGDHDAVAKWRLAQMVQRTRERRPDLLDG